MDTQEVADLYEVARITVLKWAAQNDVKREEGQHGVLMYKFTEADCKRFEKRTGKGRPAKKPEK